MSRPHRPFRSTYVGERYTSHCEYATKEDRDRYAPKRHQWQHTTVTSRKPVKRGEPVCWVNVYPDGPVAYMTVADANDAASDIYGRSRLHCIPVYLPGEGQPPGPDAYYQQWRDMKAERDAAKDAATEFANEADRVQAEAKQLRKEVERLIGELEGRERRKESDEAEACALAVQKAAEKHAAEVERLKEDLAKTLIEARGADAEVERLTKELAAAQAQAMPAGKVVYGASGKFGINRVFQTIEFADKRLRDTYRKADGWTWFTRVEES